MVKNTKGGNRHKKMARKQVNQDTVKVKTRYADYDPSNQCEMYATVIKMFGQGNCQVLCNDKKERLCVIRKKFKGRNKSRNRIAIDTKVLVGLRDWETKMDGKREKCDLLEVYDRSQHNDLKKHSLCDWSIIGSSIEKDRPEEEEETGFEFIINSGNQDIENNIIHENVESDKRENQNIMYNGDELNIDDI